MAQVTFIPHECANVQIDDHLQESTGRFLEDPRGGYERQEPEIDGLLAQGFDGRCDHSKRLAIVSSQTGSLDGEGGKRKKERKKKKGAR